MQRKVEKSVGGEYHHWVNPMSAVRNDVLLSRYIPIKLNFSFQNAHVKGVDASVYLTSVSKFTSIAHLSLIIMDSRLNALWQCFIKCRTAAADMVVCLSVIRYPILSG